MTAYIGYNNILETGTVTVTSEASGFEKENAYDWNSYDYWKAAASGTVYLTVDMGTSTTVDYWALAFHDLHDNAGTIKPQYSSGATSPFSWSDLDTVQTPTDGKTIFRPVTEVSARYYRFEISSTGSPLTASAIGMLSLGQSLTLQRGMQAPFVTPIYGRDKEILNSITKGGQFVGRTVQSSGQKFDIKQKAVTEAWIESNWEGLINHIEVKPFFFLWDQENHPTEAVYAWMNKIKYPNYTQPYYDFQIMCKGLIS